MTHRPIIVSHGLLIALMIVCGCSSNVAIEANPALQTEPEVEPIDVSIALDPPIQSEPETIATAMVESPRPQVIAVCPVPFQSQLQTWVQRRQREGLEVIVVDSQPSAASLKQTLYETGRDHCKYIWLIGDAQYSPQNETCDPDQYVPTVYRLADVSARYQEAQQLPGDFSYGDFDNDGIADAAVGRIPVKSPQQLSGYINRIIAYEDSTDFGRWRSRVDLVAGIGGFGTMIDGAIEMVASGIITGSLPGYVRTRITHASPTSDFHPGTDNFTSTVTNNYADGAKFWVYAGHGWVNELDRVPPTQFGRPVLAMSDIPNLRRPASVAPIAVMLACYTGAYDLPEDCLAERMVLADGGPIAILAGSRVTMPYGNATAAIGLIHAVYQGRSTRLGDAWLTTERELVTPTADNPELQSRRLMVDGIATVLGGGTRVDDERREHLQLYNWLGDPTLRLPVDQQVEFTTSEDAVVGQPWTLTGTTPIAGTISVEIHRWLGTLAQTPSPNLSRYEAANDTILSSQTWEVEAGNWSCQFLNLPELANKTEVVTPVIVRADVVGRTGFASGSQSTWLRVTEKSEL